MAGLGTYASALAMRDTITEIVKNVLDIERPRYRYATVNSIDNPNNKCAVSFVGESSSVNVAMGSIRPSQVGQRVRIEGIGTDRFVADVVGAPAATLPPGVLADFAGLAAPDGWLLCNGALVSKTTYSALFAVCQHYYNGGVDPGSGNFKLPDFRDRKAIGTSSTRGIGTALGTKTSSLVPVNMPAHTHTINHDHGTASAAAVGDHSHSARSSATAGGSTLAFTRSANSSVVEGGGMVGAGGGHSHSVDIPAYSGASGSSGSGTAFDTSDPDVAVPKIIKF